MVTSIQYASLLHEKACLRDAVEQESLKRKAKQEARGASKVTIARATKEKKVERTHMKVLWVRSSRGLLRSGECKKDEGPVSHGIRP